VAVRGHVIDGAIVRSGLLSDLVVGGDHHSHVSPLVASLAMIVIVPYDPAWPVMFAAESARLRRALGDLALRIEHVGSTSVPGLATKPVIDIQVSVASLEGPERYRTWLAELGYTHFSLGAFRSRVPVLQEAGRVAEHPPCSSLRRRV
jgi:GrpB-like predicted nucleotidyltransferase (UPF0157 family)